MSVALSTATLPVHVLLIVDCEPYPGSLPVALPYKLVTQQVVKGVRRSAGMLFQRPKGRDVGESPTVKSGAYLWLMAVYLVSVTSFSG